MKFIDEVYNKKLALKNEEDVFNCLVFNTRKTIKGWDYFVKWSKILENISKVELKLNILNYLIGKKDIEEATRKVLREYPEVFQVIPCLVAMREDNIRLLEENEEKIFNFSKKEKLSEKEIDEGVEFLSKSGILKLLKTEKIKNLVDYTLGVEVGLDSNGRKNRTGNAMENLIEVYVAKICKKYGYEYISQATAKAIKEKWNRDVPTDKSNRHFDFAIYNKKKLYLIETNYFSSSGSKLKSVSGEFKELFNLVKNDKTEFIWITDGEGWETAKAPLRETFNAIDYIFNFSMLDVGALEYVINEKLD